MDPVRNILPKPFGRRNAGAISNGVNATIVANGTVKNGTWFRKNVRGIIIAADGGARTCLRHGVIPDFVIGDFDSLPRKTLAALSRVSTVVHAPDQNHTDLQKAIAFARKIGITEVVVLGAIGDELDHVMANVLSLDAHCVIRDEAHEVRVVESRFAFSGKPGDRISVIALTPVRGLTYRGLRWPLSNRSVPAGWIGIRNRLTARKASISLTSGKIALIRSLS